MQARTINCESTWLGPSKGLEGFRAKSEAWKAAFFMHSLESFGNFLAKPYYEPCTIMRFMIFLMGINVLYSLPIDCINHPVI